MQTLDQAKYFIAERKHQISRLETSSQSLKRSMLMAFALLAGVLALSFTSLFWLPVFFLLLVVGVPLYLLFTHGVRGLVVNSVYYVISTKLNFYFKGVRTALGVWKFIFNTLGMVHP